MDNQNDMGRKYLLLFIECLLLTRIKIKFKL